MVLFVPPKQQTRVCSLAVASEKVLRLSLLFFCCTCTKAFTVILKGLLEDSRSFKGDPPTLTINHSFPVIWLSRPKKIA